MHPAFDRLVTRVQPLGNPVRKYLSTVQRRGELLLTIDRYASSLPEDLERVAAAGRDPEEKLVLLGTYYAIQFLHLNARGLERLAFDLAERSDRLSAYAALLERTEEEFSHLVSTYAEHVLRIVLPPDPDPFAILNVGTRGHTDDIDVAVIYGGGKNRAGLDRAMSRLAGECLRYASPFDNYVACEAGARGFTMSVDELWKALHSGKLGYVVVTELLAAQLLAGSHQVLHQVREEVMAEYFFRPGYDNSRHELYLRGLLGETRALLLHPPPPDRINPKDDALRLVLGLATAFKTIEGVRATLPGSVLIELMTRRPGLRDQIASLNQSRVFLDTFRQIAQLLIAQEEEITVVGESARENLADLAATLGYEDWGPVQAVEHLLVHYHERVEAAHSAAAPLMEEVARHLTEISSFARWARWTPPDDVATELAGSLAAATRAFRMVRFYDDLLDAFAAADGTLPEAFVKSLCSRSPEVRGQLVRVYAVWGCEAPYAFMTIMTLLSGHACRTRGIDPVSEIIDAYLERLSDHQEAVRALSRVFRFYPALANRFLLTLSSPRLDLLGAAIGVPIGNPEVAAARDRFRALMGVHRQCSLYIRRVLARVTERHPATVEAIAHDPTMRTLALGRLAASERHPSPEQQKGLLGDFYDIEFLRIAMGTLRSEPDSLTRAAFAELTATYIDRLFGFCFREAERGFGGRTPERDRIGIFLSGGTARGRPYDEDYDLLALVDATNPADRRFAERVVVLMNRQIARRGVIAQYRLGEWLGHFATTLDELAELLSRDEDEFFVDRCQLLGSKMIAGSRSIQKQLVIRVLRPLVFAEAEAFSTRVVRELTERRQLARKQPAGTINIKEGAGGLREIDLCLAIAQARFGVWAAPRIDVFDQLGKRDENRANLYERLHRIYDFLVAVRSAYRVTVAATDVIERDQLPAPARILGYEGPDEAEAVGVLFADIERRLAESAQLVDELSEALACPS
jgi:hypothetical protein